MPSLLPSMKLGMNKVCDAKSAALDEVSDAKSSAVNKISNAKSTAISEISIHIEELNNLVVCAQGAQSNVDWWWKT